MNRLQFNDNVIYVDDEDMQALYEALQDSGKVQIYSPYIKLYEPAVHPEPATVTTTGATGITWIDYRTTNGPFQFTRSLSPIDKK